MLQTKHAEFFKTYYPSARADAAMEQRNVEPTSSATTTVVENPQTPWVRDDPGVNDKVQ